MKPLQASIRRVGNSLGILIPKPILSQVGLSDRAEMTIKGDAIVLRRPRGAVRGGWAEAAEKLAANGEDSLLLGEFGNSVDAELDW